MVMVRLARDDKRPTIWLLLESPGSKHDLLKLFHERRLPKALRFTSLWLVYKLDSMARRLVALAAQNGTGKSYWRVPSNLELLFILYYDRSPGK